MRNNLNYQEVITTDSINLSFNILDCTNLVDKEDRIFIDSLDIGGQSFKKNIHALDGGEDGAESKATAAAIVQHLIIRGNRPNDATFNIAFAVQLDPSLKSDFNGKLSKMLSANSNEAVKIKLGNSNKNQQFKTDDYKWGKLIDLSSLELNSVPELFKIDMYEDESFSTTSTSGVKLYIITVSGLVSTSKESIDYTTSDRSTDNRVYQLKYTEN